MKRFQNVKLSAVDRSAFSAFSAAANVGTLAESIMAVVRRAARHPMTEGAVLLAVSQYLAAAIGLITSIVSARLLGPKDFGLTAVIMSYPMLLGALLAVKSGTVTTRYISAFRERYQDDALESICLLGFTLDFVVSLTAFILVAATAWWVAEHFFYAPGAAWLMVAFAAAFPIWSLHGTSGAILTSFQRFRWVAGLQILDQAISSVLVIGLLVAGFGVTGAVLGTAAGHVLKALIATTVASSVFYRERSTYWWHGSLARVKPLRKEISRLFGWNYLAVTWSGLIAQLPLMILAHLRGPEAAGFYRLATSIVTAGSYLETSMGKVAYPTLSMRWGADSRERFRQALQRWTLQAGLPVGLLVLLTIPFLPMIVPIVFGAHYAPMVPGVQIMMAGAAVSAIFFWLNSFYYASANVSLWTIGYALQTIIVIGMAWIFVGRWGFPGMAVLSAAGKVAFTLTMTVVFYKLASSRSTGKENIS
jgi:O-antigen/teichoic acid export membrane protein